MTREKRIPDRRFRKRAAIAGAIAAVVLAGSAATLLHLSGIDAATAATASHRASVSLPTSTPSPGPDVSTARARLSVVLLGAGGVLRNGADKAPPEQLAQLQAAIDVGRLALDGDDGVALVAARDALTTAQTAVETSVAVWTTEQTRVAAEAAAAQQAAASQAAAEADKKAAAAAAKQTQAAPKAGPKSPIAAPVATAPEPVAVLAPPTAAPAPADPLTAGRDANAWFTAHLVGIGATGFTISSEWTTCGQPDSGPRYLQGCARSDQPTVIFMKQVEASLASTEVGRGVVIHEWAHLLQYRLGYAAAIQASDAVYGAGLGLEQSADCMAIQLGAHGKPGGYTSDCSGARGTLAAAFVAGRLS